MPQVLLVNPSPRKGKSKMATRKKARSPAQRAATAKLVRLNKSRSSAARRKARPKRRPTIAGRAQARRSARAPGRPTKVRARRRRLTSARAASVAGRTLRYRQPNPIGNFVSGTLIPSAVGGAGALALDIALAALPLPDAMKNGPMAPLVKVAGAVGLGMLASQFLGRKTGEQVAAGALTVTIYNVARKALAGIKKKDGTPMIPGLSMYTEGPMGEYVSGDETLELGYADSGMQVGDTYLMPDGSVAGYETGVYR